MYERLEIECASPSCARCKHKCEDYLKEYPDIEYEELMQGNITPMVRRHGALRRK